MAANLPQAIPKVLNFIWVGGPIPKDYLNKIRSLTIIAEKSGFELNLWVDNRQNYYQTSEKEEIRIENPNFKLKTISEMVENMKKDPFYTDPKKPALFRHFLSYLMREMVGQKNLAGFADFFRMEPLRQRGGYYYDTDTLFKTLLSNTNAPLPELTPDRPLHGFLCDPATNFNAMNDILASVPNGIIVENIILKLIENALVLDHFSSLDEMRKTNAIQDPSNSFSPMLLDKKRQHLLVYPTDGNTSGEDRRSLQIVHFGPGVVTEVIKAYAAENKCKYEELFFETIGDPYKYTFKVAGLPTTSKCDNTWLKHQDKEIRRMLEIKSKKDKGKHLPSKLYFKNSKEEAIVSSISILKPPEFYCLFVLPVEPNLSHLDEKTKREAIARFKGKQQAVTQILKNCGGEIVFDPFNEHIETTISFNDPSKAMKALELLMQQELNDDPIQESYFKKPLKVFKVYPKQKSFDDSSLPNYLTLQMGFESYQDRGTKTFEVPKDGLYFHNGGNYSVVSKIKIVGTERDEFSACQFQFANIKNRTQEVTDFDGRQSDPILFEKRHKEYIEILKNHGAIKDTRNVEKEIYIITNPIQAKLAIEELSHLEQNEPYSLSFFSMTLESLGKLQIDAESRTNKGQKT